MVYYNICSSKFSHYCQKFIRRFSWRTFQCGVYCKRYTHSIIHHLPANMTSSPSNIQFYKRVLPSSCIAFGSEEGKKIFIEALQSEYGNIYFPLAEQFRTQNEPAYCGLSTLVMVLNALAVDPKRVWKGPWRWYHEEMLDCCLSLDVVQQQGITMEQFVCLATCNNLDLNVVRMSENESIEEFRNVVKTVCNGSGRILVCSYSRKVLGQTGDGHFSPIGAYHPGKDMILIFDVARFKYPPHWVTVTQMWEAMKAHDVTTDLPRGYIVMRKTEESELLLFRLSNIFRVTIASHNLQESHMAKFVNSWRKFLSVDNNCTLVCTNLENAVIYALSSLNVALGMILDDESVFTTQFNTCCIEILPTQHVNAVNALLKSIENTQIYSITDKWVKDFKRNNQTLFLNGKQLDKNNLAYSKDVCCRVDRVGLSITDNQSEQTDEVSKCDQKNYAIHSEPNLVTDSHYITMFLLSWPYKTEHDSTYTNCLIKYIEDALSASDYILQNESKQLRQRIHSLVAMMNSHVTERYDGI